MTPLAHVYQSTLFNNKTFTLKEMIRQPDKDKFIEAMHEEVTSMFREDIWEMAPKHKMLEHYKKKKRRAWR